MQLLHYIGQSIQVNHSNYFLMSCIHFLDGSLLNDTIDLVRDCHSSHIINANVQLNINLTRIAVTISIHNLY